MKDLKSYRFDLLIEKENISFGKGVTKAPPLPNFDVVSKEFYLKEEVDSLLEKYLLELINESNKYTEEQFKSSDIVQKSLILTKMQTISWAMKKMKEILW